MGEKTYTEHLVCSKTTKKLILNDCVEEFLEHHPEFKGYNITQDFILRKIVEYYLEH
jgi:hypothetical protein